MRISDWSSDVCSSDLQTRVNDLPSVQTAKIKAALDQGDCIAKMEYANGVWNIVTGWNDGNDVCSSIRQVEPVRLASELIAPPIYGAAPAPSAVVAPAPGAVAGPPMPQP